MLHLADLNVQSQENRANIRALNIFTLLKEINFMDFKKKFEVSLSYSFPTLTVIIMMSCFILDRLDRSPYFVWRPEKNWFY